MQNIDLHNKTALVTGASRGLGKEIAISLANAGANVIINYRNSTEDAKAVVDSVLNAGGKALMIQADVAIEQDVKSMFEQIHGEFGNVDILVNNAGINPTISIDKLTVEQFEKTISTNLTSAFLATQLAVPGMKENGFGRIINISSIAAQTGGVIGPHYAASKAGMIGLTHSYAKLLADWGITVNAVAPALIETEMIKDNPNITPALIPLGRFGLPSEVASVVLMLSGNGYITGQTFNVNGGWYMS